MSSRTRMALSLALVTGCASLGPTRPGPEPPTEWAKPSVLRDCDTTCAPHAGAALEVCLADCQAPPRICGMSTMQERWNDSALRILAVSTGVAAVITGALFASGTVSIER